jgi:hypothetical protein
MNKIRINISYEELETRRKRWEKVMRFEVPDRIPVLQYIGSRYWLELIGHKDDFLSYFDDPATMLQAQLKGQKWILEHINSDFHHPVVYPDFMWVEDVSGFGAETVFPKDDSPWVARPHFLENDEDLERLRKVDYVNTGLHGKMISYYHKMKEIAGDFEIEYSDGKVVPATEYVYPGGAGVIGIAALAGDLCGVEKFSLDLYDKPDWVRELLNIIVEKSIDWIRAVLDLQNGEMAFCSDYCKSIIHIGDDGTAQMSPNQFQELMIPAFKKFVSFIKAEDCLVQAHNCGKSDHIIQFWADDIGVDRYIGFSYLTDKEMLRNVMGNRIILMGGIDTVKIHDATPDEVIEDVRMNLDHFKNCRGFVVMDGHNVAPGSPVENINAMMTAVEKYGRF